MSIFLFLLFNNILIGKQTKYTDNLAWLMPFFSEWIIIIIKTKKQNNNNLKSKYDFTGFE